MHKDNKNYLTYNRLSDFIGFVYPFLSRKKLSSCYIVPCVDKSTFGTMAIGSSDIFGLDCRDNSIYIKDNVDFDMLLNIYKPEYSILEEAIEEFCNDNPYMEVVPFDKLSSEEKGRIDYYIQQGRIQGMEQTLSILEKHIGSFPKHLVEEALNEIKRSVAKRYREV